MNRGNHFPALVALVSQWQLNFLPRNHDWMFSLIVFLLQNEEKTLKLSFRACRFSFCRFSVTRSHNRPVGINWTWKSNFFVMRKPEVLTSTSLSFVGRSRPVLVSSWLENYLIDLRGILRVKKWLLMLSREPLRVHRSGSKCEMKGNITKLLQIYSNLRFTNWLNWIVVTAACIRSLTEKRM